jgi:hypothetical protein
MTTVPLIIQRAFVWQPSLVMVIRCIKLFPGSDLDPESLGIAVPSDEPHLAGQGYLFFCPLEYHMQVERTPPVRSFTKPLYPRQVIAEQMAWSRATYFIA